MSLFLVLLMVSWEKIRKVLPLIGVVIFVYLLMKLNIIKILREVSNASQAYLLIAFVFVFVFLSFDTAKWYLIARKQKIDIPFKDAFKINLITSFYGLITPAKLGTLMRIDYLRKYTKSIGKGMGNIVIDKVLDLSSLFLLAIGLGFVFRQKLNTFFLYYLLGLFIIMILSFLVFYDKERSRRVLRIFYRKVIPKKMKRKAKVTFDSFYEDMPKKRVLFGVFIINLTTWIMNYWVVYLVGLSLGIRLNFVYFLAILPLSTLVSQIPITINGLGTRELTMMGLFGLFEVEAIKIFSMSLINILLAGILPSLVAILIILKEKEKNEIYNLEKSR